MQGKLIAAGAATVTSAAFQLSTVIWPDWIRRHTPYVAGLWILAAVVWLWFLADRLRDGIGVVGPNTPYAPPVNAPINIAPVFNVSPTFTNTQATEVAPPTPVSDLPASVTPPVVYVSEPEVRRAAFQGLAWKIYDYGQLPPNVPGVILWVYNNPASAGGKSEKLSRLFVSISYKEQGKTPSHVSRAFWIGHSENEVDIDIGGRKAFLVGTIFGSSALKICENPRSTPWQPPMRIHQSMSIPALEESIAQFTDKLVIEASIISAVTGHTLQVATLDVTKDGQVMNIVKRA